MTLAIELRDTGVRLASADGVLAESPGYALVDARNLLIGEQALRRCRLDPRHATNRFWQRLSMDPVTHPHPSARTQADLVHGHLLHLWETAGSDDEEIIFAIPGHYSREQMALLLGIVRECPFRAVGLVDAAVAAIGEIQPDAERVLHVDALLHQGIITRLEGGDDWRRESVVDQPALGLAALRDAWINQIADVFIRETRFDPLHDAATEQRLFDRLDDWITALVDRPEVQVELETGNQVYRVELDRQQLVDRVAPRYQALREALDQSLDGASGVLLLGAELARLPGLIDLIAESGRFDVRVMTGDAAVRGALRHESGIRQDGDALRFITRLPRTPIRSGTPTSQSRTPTESWTPTGSSDVDVGVQAPGDVGIQASQAPDDVGVQAADDGSGDVGVQAPTHVLVEDTAWPLTAEQLTIGGPDGIGRDRWPTTLGELERTPEGWQLMDARGRREPMEAGLARVLGPERVLVTLIRVRPEI